MSDITQRLDQVRERIRAAAAQFNRDPAAIGLLAVSKTRPAGDIRQALEAGQRRFGENYLQEALTKIGQLHGSGAEWHFIGRIQGNKTRPIAEHFDWVHSIDREKHARRLNDQRPGGLPPLNICLQVRIDQEESKGGLDPDQAAALIALMPELPRLRLRGLMTLPAPSDDPRIQRRAFRALRELRDRLASTTLPLTTLSMGMSEDLESAIAEGSTLVRVGTAIFGPRQARPANDTTQP
ncbi:MAG: YggS family pyridoxal phosphate enzyme [Candidatus Sedimenticola endophacoides]|uniref:Pyridoxal phosphate homeostasis protein n=1 Tax=Candidatus Sedimenticola endophacoides TaxID=2548426 RepID=A0A6N4DVF8_9GAMM|nr:MAG: YggS family pyridoxal phosphate enzyme [Candidatus Sedimenticola endophacoides]OQX35268.1 MAG: YggS family pyridoxal phosphate enzyme [Candidatus Sedimenticola endophacoides]OQX40610.1 MAG: YggS family pyridoxal phosphate enzyme [Candidatus Sedimenticola endophacoides]OQX41138.1 MAG: YggS family pyridoxal phosphate enzyme [Candidatus Sedimenticola endophacoides]PUE00011.1 MAG: YggS family pyridoxal phosphate-dependent enzyme [Candidatus Sedimenticola endophacoides]